MFKIGDKVIFKDNLILKSINTNNNIFEIIQIIESNPWLGTWDITYKLKCVTEFIPSLCNYTVADVYLRKLTKIEETLLIGGLK